MWWIFGKSLVQQLLEKENEQLKDRVRDLNRELASMRSALQSARAAVDERDARIADLEQRWLCAQNALKHNLSSARGSLDRAITFLSAAEETAAGRSVVMVGDPTKKP